MRLIRKAPIAATIIIAINIFNAAKNITDKTIIAPIANFARIRPTKITIKSTIRNLTNLIISSIKQGRESNPPNTGYEPEN